MRAVVPLSLSCASVEGVVSEVMKKGGGLLSRLPTRSGCNVVKDLVAKSAQPAGGQTARWTLNERGCVFSLLSDDSGGGGGGGAAAAIPVVTREVFSLFSPLVPVCSAFAVRTHRVSQKQLRRSAWPSLQWSSDEVIAARGLDNDIQARK